MAATGSSTSCGLCSATTQSIDLAGHVGEKPMAITRELAHPLWGDLYSAVAAAVA